MGDLLYIGLAVGFFAATIAIAYAFERVRERK